MNRYPQKRLGPILLLVDAFHPNPVRKVAWVLASAATLLLLAIFGVWWIGGPVFPSGTLRSLRGKTRDEVRQILGEPSEIGDHDEWYYLHPRNPGWVTLYFHEDGRIAGVNDEQAAPELFGSGSW